MVYAVNGKYWTKLFFSLILSFKCNWTATCLCVSISSLVFFSLVQTFKMTLKQFLNISGFYLLFMPLLHHIVKAEFFCKGTVVKPVGD